MEPSKMLRSLLIPMIALQAISLLDSKAERGNPRIQFQGQGVDDMIATFMEENGVSGMSLAIVQAPYITRVSGYGLADPVRKTLVGTNTIFDVGQMRNAYTAVAVMQLVESGKVTLDDSISKYLPDEKGHETVRELGYGQDSSDHGTVFPKQCMPYSEYKAALESTAPMWQYVFYPTPN